MPTVTVDCRIGSLEIPDGGGALVGIVDCRIGSLETKANGKKSAIYVDCRIGSLEKHRERIFLVAGC